MSDFIEDHLWTPVATPPARQTYYHVKCGPTGTRHLAEWREHVKGQGKRWWLRQSADPTRPHGPVPLDGVTHYAPASRATVEAARLGERTVDEHVEQAYRAFLSRNNVPLDSIPAVPARRQLQVEEAVEVGSLAECQVAALRDDGRVVVVRYRDHDKLAYVAWPWYAAVKVPEQPPTAGRVKRLAVLNNAYVNTNLASLLSRFLRGVDSSPKYQRDYAWSAADKDRLLESLFAGRDLGRFIFVKREYPHRSELLDGKQRLSTIADFFLGRIAYRGVYWDQLDSGDRDCIEESQVQYADLNGARLKESDLLAVFLTVNAAGVPQTQEHLAYVQGLYEEALAREAAATLATSPSAAA